MTATLQKSIVVCTVIAMTVTVAGADSFSPAVGVSPCEPAISSTIFVSKANFLPNIVFEQDIFNSNIQSCLTWDMASSDPGHTAIVGESNPRVNAQVKSLPPAPGAVIMGLIGFLIVTLVRDRKFWMSLFAGLVVIGQAGILSVPRIAARLTQNKQQVAPLTTDNFLILKWENVVEKNNAELTHYIGLLRRLSGSPDDAAPSLSEIRRLCAACNLLKLVSLEGSNSFSWRNSTPQSAFIDGLNRYSGLSSPICLLRHISPSNYYSPAFAFQCRPRGPPLSNT